MKKTTTYQLNQWEKSDRIQMEDFNSDNMKVEQALAAQAETQREMAAALANCGNCKIVHNTYNGTGKYGSSNPCQMTFNAIPLLVIVVDKDGATLFMHRSSAYAYSGSAANFVSWSDTTISWYSNGDAAYQFNEAGSIYQVFALFLTN